LIRIKEEAMAKFYQSRNATGYSFPRLPEGWSEKERQFGIRLRDLFDRIFSDQETQDRNVEANGVRIDETNEKFDKEVKNTNNHLAETNDALEDTTDRLDELLAALGTAFNIIYPIGIVVLTTGADAPFPFGTWVAALTDPDTGDPVPDSDGHYRWQRTV
jgi:hypothetical protein